MKVLFKNGIRKTFMLWMYDWSQKVYVKHFKKNKQAWALKINDLSSYPAESLGQKLYMFLIENHFQLMPKLERHDIYHILTNTKTELKDEIGMQYLLLGNGKRSLYMAAMILIGTCIYPEHFSYYLKKYKEGKSYSPFHHLDFEHRLKTSMKVIQIQFNILK